MVYLIVINTFLVIIISLYFWKSKSSDNFRNFMLLLEKNEKVIRDDLQRIRQDSMTQSKENREELSKSFNLLLKYNDKNQEKFTNFLRDQFQDFNNLNNQVRKASSDSLKDIRNSVEKYLESIQANSNKKLDEMRRMVDDKLQITLEKRLSDSFKQVSERLEQVHKGLGEMQSIAAGVGDLKKVLSNVKTRGILGEYQLENILEQILTESQYLKNVITKRHSNARVEFAVKLPGKDDNSEILLPIDSKFPLESYQYLLDAYDLGNKDDILGANKRLNSSIINFAQDISSKYIDPPYTTDFAIMFVPVESLYAEILRQPNLFEKLQRTYKITVTGPTTLSAFLNSLQMGFRTLAVQRRSSEVWDVLESIKTEFDKFSIQLDKVDKHLNTASKSLNDLRITRTNVMQKKLKDIRNFEIEAPDGDILKSS